MSQDDTPDLATPHAGKVAPEAVALRAQPRPVTRLNRRSLAILAGVLAVAVLGALMWSLQPHRRSTGEKVYIQFPPGIAQGELPPLFVIGAQGDGQLVNYRFRAPYYIVDRLFGAAEQRLGGDKGDVVRIERTDGVARRN